MSVSVKEVIEKLRLDIVYGEPELLEKEFNRRFKEKYKQDRIRYVD